VPLTLADGFHHSCAQFTSKQKPLDIGADSKVIYLRQGLTSEEGFDTALKEAQQAYPDKTINQLKAMGDEALMLLDALRKK